MKQFATKDEAICEIKLLNAYRIAKEQEDAKIALEKEIARIHESRAKAEKVIPMTEDEIRESAMKRTPRYWYVKNVEINGITYDAEIDALTGNINFG